MVLRKVLLDEILASLLNGPVLPLIQHFHNVEDSLCVEIRLLLVELIMDIGQRLEEISKLDVEEVLVLDDDLNNGDDLALGLAPDVVEVVAHGFEDAFDGVSVFADPVKDDLDGLVDEGFIVVFFVPGDGFNGLFKDGRELVILGVHLAADFCIDEHGPLLQFRCNSLLMQHIIIEIHNHPPLPLTQHHHRLILQYQEHYLRYLNQQLIPIQTILHLLTILNLQPSIQSLIHNP